MLRVFITLSLLAIAASSCDNSCSGHGVCLDNGVCECYEGWGMGLSYDSGDCSQRICPFEYAWVDTPDRIGDHHKYVECSAKGICNRDSGECECFPGYEGKACARTTCPNDCSGHGQCVYLDNEPFKTVIGDYNNYNYGVTYDEELVTMTATTAKFKATPSFVANLVVNSRVALAGVIYWVVSIESSTEFKLSATAPALGVPGTVFNNGGTDLAATAATILASKDKRSFQVGVGVSGTSFASVIPHGLSAGDYVYLTGAFVASAEKVDNNVFYTVDAVSSPTEFTLKQASGGLVAPVQPTATVGTTTGGLRVTNTVICNVIDIKDIPQGQFDVVDPYTATSFIDKKYWDAKKTRGCVCDPQYGDVDCSARMCQHGTDVMDSQKDQTRAAQNHIQIVSMKAPTDYATGFLSSGAARTFSLTFKSKLNETFSTIPLNMPVLTATTTTADGLQNIRNFELDVEWALKTLPNSVIDGVKVHVTKPIDTTGVTPISGTYTTTSVVLAATGVSPSTTAGSIGGTTSGHNVFEFSVEFSGNNVQGTQHYLTVESAVCGNGCFPKVSGVVIDSTVNGNTFITVVTKPTSVLVWIMIWKVITIHMNVVEEVNVITRQVFAHAFLVTQD